MRRETKFLVFVGRATVIIVTATGRFPTIGLLNRAEAAPLLGSETVRFERPGAAQLGATRLCHPIYTSTLHLSTAK
jgi:hypothetical protein